MQHRNRAAYPLPSTGVRTEREPRFYPYLNITSNSISELVQRAGESSVLSQNTELTLSTTGSVFKRELLQRVSITTELQRRQGR
jgi:hypothetical protein